MKTFPILTLITFLIITISCAQDQKDAFATLSVTEFQNEIQDKNTLLVDVRTPEEYQSGRIGQAQNWNIYDADFLKHFDNIEKDKPIYLYCRSGGRSGQAAQKLIDAGFKDVHHLDGGITAWEQRE